jgi:hypothetical protein
LGRALFRRGSRGCESDRETCYCFPPPVHVSRAFSCAKFIGRLCLVARPRTLLSSKGSTVPKEKSSENPVRLGPFGLEPTALDTTMFLRVLSPGPLEMFGYRVHTALTRVS